MIGRFLILSCLVAFLVGCSGEQVNREYGKIRESSSLNGTTVLARMFEQEGAKVTTARRLTPKLFAKADCIVWFPDDFDLPREEVVRWFEDWLAEEPGRTLLYVARDYESAVDYWERVQDEFESKKDRADARAEWLTIRNVHKLARRMESDVVVGEWFSIASGDLDEPETLTSEAGWLEGVDVKKTDLRLGNYPVFDAYFESLLETEDGPFVARTFFEDGQLIVVANGSFLLNYPLVNHEHRKLAAKLIETVGTEGRVVFVESGFTGLKIAEEDESTQPSWEIVTWFPFNWMLAQFVALGVVFCFCRWPVFGRPRTLQRESLTDFGRHITALGRLLRKRGDKAFAEEVLRKYHEEGVRHTRHER